MTEYIRKKEECHGLQMSEREKRNRNIARRAASEGIVLLKNKKHLLPLRKGRKIALYGNGAVSTIKGGTGSGDVNERESVSIVQGMINKGFEITTQKWLEDYKTAYRMERENWKSGILELAGDSDLDSFFQAYSSHPFQLPSGRLITEDDIKDSNTDTAVYVLARTAGEAADRKDRKGDYYLADEEMEHLRVICQNYKYVILIINSGGIVDLSFLCNMPQIYSVLYMVQAGMEGGNALADILSGDCTPSGKLTDTWAKDYKDYPSSQMYGSERCASTKDYYEEGIYVGYRYFDSFGVSPQFPFGFGLSYTQFKITANLIPVKVEDELGYIKVFVQVKNIGEIFAGKEVVQVYISCPQGKLAKEYRRLCGFVKTECLMPGEEEELVIKVPVEALTSFVEEEHAWRLEEGTYGVWIGNSLQSLQLSAGLQVDKTVHISENKPICPLQETIKEITRSEKEAFAFEQSWKDELKKRNLPVIKLSMKSKRCHQATEGQKEIRNRNLPAELTMEEMFHIVIGEISKGQGNQEAFVGAAGTMVPGAAGETSSILYDTYGIPGMTMADGPAGLRLKKRYQVSRKNGMIISEHPFSAFEGGYFVKASDSNDADTVFQYCTAFPVGTLLAQSWNIELVEEVGRAVGEEMQEFQISIWLAPGMNIHRNPLCGRNFEYFSEDPLVSGCIAAGIIKGVQSQKGRGCTMKHFACNNREDNRMKSDSIVSERALREIYLKGFEIAVALEPPAAIMTSYNMVNGVHSANSYDLCTEIVRKEWGFKGIIMTDWSTTSKEGGSSAWKCIAAGNDLIMPGTRKDISEIREALRRGELNLSRLKESVDRIILLSKTL